MRMVWPEELKGLSESRARIVQTLFIEGPIVSRPSGQATALLYDQMGKLGLSYPYSRISLGPLLSRMYEENPQLIELVGNTRRTHEIDLADWVRLAMTPDQPAAPALRADG